MKRARALLACLLIACAGHASARMAIQAAGEVAHAGTLVVPGDARLSTAALAAAPRAGAYLLGAAWLRPALQRSQVRLKAGVLYDLTALHTRAVATGDAGLAATAQRLHAWLSSLPVTGRSPRALLDPRVVEATPAADWPVAPGDTLFYPTRPSSVSIVGAVRAACTLAFEPLAGAQRYLARCPAAPGADPDWAFVIEPDGAVFRRGIALWNRAASPLPLAPGAVVYVPIDAGAAAAIDPELNGEVAHFLATQTLPAGASGRSP